MASAPPVNATAYAESLVNSIPLFRNAVYPVYKQSTITELYTILGFWVIGFVAYSAAMVFSVTKSRTSGERIYLYRFLERPEGRYVSLNALAVWRTYYRDPLRAFDLQLMHLQYPSGS